MPRGASKEIREHLKGPVVELSTKFVSMGKFVMSHMTKKPLPRFLAQGFL